MTLLEYDLFEFAIAGQSDIYLITELYYRVLLRDATVVYFSVNNMAVLATCKPLVDG
jgi:hypothetical protein